MPDDVLFSLDKAKDLKAINIIENLQGKDGDVDFQSGKVKVNGKFYDIQFVKDNDKVYVDVKRDFKGVFSYFRNRWGNKHTNCANELKSSIVKILKSKEYVLTKNNFDALLSLARNSKIRDIEIGNYGFTNNRNLVIKQSVVGAVKRTLQKEGIDKKLTFNKIDTYNDIIGVTTKTLNIDNYFNIMSQLKNKKLTIDEKYHKKSKIPENKVRAWMAFIQKPENASKIDIVGKLHSYMNQDKNINDNEKQTGWKADFKKNPDQALKNFIIKNSSIKMSELTPEFLDEATKNFKELININNFQGEEKDNALKNFFREDRWLTNDDKKLIDSKLIDKMSEDDCSLDQALDDLYNGDKRNHNKMYMFLNNVLMYATFRQTSKLGLEFFHDNKIPVLFQHANRKHIDLDEKNAMNNILSENFWKDGSTDKSVKGSEITHSEIRHAKRLEETYGDGAGIFYVAGAKYNDVQDENKPQIDGNQHSIGTKKDAFVEIEKSKYK